MEPYLSRIEAIRDKYHFRWILHKNPHAFVIAVGSSLDLCDTPRIFVVPGHIRSCDLDLGPGQWYGRIGSMVGDEFKGVIAWSGVYGPHSIQSNKPILPPIQATGMPQAIPIDGGVRFRNGSTIPAYYIFQTWTNDPISGKWTYCKDVGRGYADCGGIEYQTNYNICVRRLESIPCDTIVQLADGILFEAQTSAKPTPILDSTDHAIRAATNALLRQTTFQQNVRFASHADYVRYQAALAKVAGGKA
jgi:hypothetical protein